MCTACGFHRRQEQPRRKSDSSWSLASVKESVTKWFKKGSDEKGDGSGVHDGRPKWCCKHCTFDNPDRENKCVVCNQPRSLSGDAVESLEFSDSAHRNWVPHSHRSILGTQDAADEPAMQSTEFGVESSLTDHVSPQSNIDDSFPGTQASSRKYPTGHRQYVPQSAHHGARTSGSVSDGFHSMPVMQESEQNPLEFSSMVSSREADRWQCSNCGTCNVMRLTKCYACSSNIPAQYQERQLQPTLPPPAVGSPVYIYGDPSGGGVLLVPGSALPHYQPHQEQRPYPRQPQYPYPRQEWQPYPQPHPRQDQYGYTPHPPYHDVDQQQLPYPNFQQHLEHQYPSQSQRQNHERGREGQRFGRDSVPSRSTPVPARRLERKLSDCGPSSLEESIRGNRTKLILEQKQEDEAEASRIFKSVQEYCKQV